MNPIKNFIVIGGVDRAGALEIADQNKLKLFSKFLMTPKEEEVSLVSVVKEYDSFWFIRGHRSITFDRKVQYRLVLDNVVEYADIGGKKFKPKVEKDSESKKGGKVRALYIPVRERCHVEMDITSCVNTSSGKEDPDFIQLLDSDIEEIENIDSIVESESVDEHNVITSEINFGIDPAMDIYRKQQDEQIGELESIVDDTEELQRGIVYVGRYNITYRYVKDKRSKSVHVGAYSGYVSY